MIADFNESLLEFLIENDLSLYSNITGKTWEPSYDYWTDNEGNEFASVNDIDFEEL